ncbi:hypothetical protein Sta7437_1801 [Stanieria cyanosphaera PCC 7437]|uniref:Glutathione S-transferase n=1 Tax=Stanieria cyanosphaera (strain ATCC 29371 / PCC 7437) TaxID=111780 RepID=K9XTG8_STAC7|nr:hypothetical protein [Stanieria cyanosphaera]AFZ35359.1 hypothetical protein Sta7437_1801 [Stanieria cyanosphaera PCC 7437]
MKNRIWYVSLTALITLVSQTGLTLPPPEDLPEEILRTEIILEARSPITGEPLTAAEYAQLQIEIAQIPFAQELNPELRQLIFLLQIRKLFKTFFPF